MPHRREPASPVASSEKKALDFFEQNKSFLEVYAGDSSIRVEKSPAGLDTFAIDLQKGVLYADPKYFEDQGYSEHKAFFAFLHEFEHFRELKTLLQEKGGERIWKTHSEKLQKSRRLSLLDNCWDDVRMNRSVVSRAPAQETARRDLYQENLFPTADFSSRPKHLQFAFALLRERMLPDEACVVHADVRAELDRLDAITSASGISLLDYASRPDIAPSARIQLQERFLEPVYERFFQEDAEQKKENESAEQEQGEGGGEQGKEQEQEQEEEKEQGGAQKPGGAPENPEDFFKKEYDAFFEQSPDTALPEEAIEEAVKKYTESKSKHETGKSEEEELAEAYAREHGVTREDIEGYAHLWDEVERIANPDTGESVVEELRELFRKIITERRGEKYRSKQPVREGDLLIKPAEAVAAVAGGETEPAVWRTRAKKERKEKLFGNFDVTLVLDRSGSMQYSDASGAVKYVEQKKAAVLLLEALKEFSDDLDDARADMADDLHVRTEAWSFGGHAETVVLKPLDETLTERQRISIAATLDSVPGSSTEDYAALEAIARGITDEDKERMAKGDLKKIVIVLTDGDSSDADRARRVAGALREAGVTVVGVGITADGAGATSTYAPDGMVCQRADRLAAVLGGLLQEHLKR